MEKLPVYVEIKDLKAQEVLTALRMAGVNITDFITEAFKAHKTTESKTLAKVA